jgi:hypothetical protein
MSLLLLCLSGLLAIGFGQTGTAGLQLFPKHFVLHPGERIHYQVRERSENGRLREPPHYEFATSDPKIARLIDPMGMFEAVAAGRTDLVVRTPTSEVRVPIEVAGPAQRPMKAVPFNAVPEIVGKELLFVGHANLGGYDHTAVAKPGIDRLVKEAKKKGRRVVYWVSEEYPDWYTTDRRPELAIISEGQEHQIRVKAQRVLFTGGDFMFCLLRNVQMTLHGMIKNNVTRRINFVFPAQAIWAADIWGPGEKRQYPAPMVLLSALFARRADDTQAYDEVVLPFLNRMVNQFPVAGYPASPPTPPITDLLKDWNIVVRFGDRFERVYQRADSNKTLLLEFRGVRTAG